MTLAHNYIYQDEGNILVYEGIQYGSGGLFADSQFISEVKQVGEKRCFPQKKFPSSLNVFFKNPLMMKEFLPHADMISEDAYLLNIFAPKGRKDCPVMVYIHGGAMTGGSANVSMYRGIDLARQGIIVVSFNYRLNTPGMLWVDGNGNRAYKDQHLALKWVKENIDLFGGDPNNITLAGQSSGALSVLVQMTQKKNRGLFQRGIIMSPVLPEIRTMAEAEEKTKRALAKAGINDVHKASQGELLKIRDQFMSIVIDEVFCEAAPLEVLKSGEALDIPLMIGSCGDEFSMYNHLIIKRFLGMSGRRKKAEMKLKAHLNEDYDEMMPLLIQSGRPADGQLKLLEYVFHTAVLEIMEAHSSQNDVYGYYFNYIPPIFGGKNGAYHGADITMLFNQLEIVDDAYQQEVGLFQEDVLSFIREGRIDHYSKYQKHQRMIRFYEDGTKWDEEYPHFKLIWRMMEEGVFNRFLEDCFSKWIKN